MGKKKSSTTQTTTSQPPAWATPIIQGGANSVMNTYNQNAGNLSNLESGLTGSILPSLTQQATSTANLQPGFDYTKAVLGGQYLNSNPYTDAMTARAGQDAGNAVNSAFSMAGRTGSANHATDLARGVDQAENSVMFQNYQNERANQNAAAGMLPSLTSAQYSGYTPLLAATQLAGQLPYYGSQSLGTIGSLLGNYGTSTAKGSQPGGWGNDVLNAAVSALPFIL